MRKTQKLVIRTETIRALSSQEIAHAAGGDGGGQSGLEQCTKVVAAPAPPR